MLTISTSGAQTCIGLALIILLDQLTRNAFRGEGKAFAFDHHARETTTRLLGHPHIDALRPVERVFLLLPLEHHESLESHAIFRSNMEQVLQECEAAGEAGAGAVGVTVDLVN